VIENQLGGCSLPGNHPANVDSDLKFLKEQKGITAIISLNEAALDTAKVKEYGMEHLILAVKDYYPPSIDGTNGRFCK